ncbi:class A beta-lactamase-related serine hydrolase [Macrococcus armenti]|uniref:serine hydrolase n=1 Tax=Macrococcus armenti TaxID=2875764 RepID=UPI001CCF2366|nr:serine hydrolase [Macrococcus armenti]UBH15102.1 class A beta-lactamase-related serine hydrolase [Macrococcus armenti]UBH17463.1 class A beta-lactamase-related serine hydrolase [Macrococcus armenti]UBH19727.1 class A beta-lactamase-related serine hydrolase [Macrococcus armenti]UBH22095.1 class A beta-lactamase-related serine hydrolase [Macrococcus armenti]
MNIFSWIGLTGIIIFTLIPLLSKENRTKQEVRKAIITIVIVIGIIVAVMIFNVNFLNAILFGVIAMILFDKKTYTKKRLIIYGAIILVIGIAGYSVFRDNPDYVLNHLKNHPETSSLYVAENGEELITYQSDVVRPLASTVKILIAVEYAMQVEEGILNKESYVPLDKLKKFYYKGTDGNAHEAWLKTMEDEGKIVNNEITLHDVAKGMITYSSNANTDYLIHVLGIDSINEQAQSLGLTSHEEIYPLVGGLLIPDYLKNIKKDENKLIEELEKMPMEMYRETAEELSQQMKDGTFNIEDHTFDMPLDLQRVWSDRLIGASANDYGRLLAIISNNELQTVAAQTVRDLLEWPMEVNEANNERFTHLGAKGGSTAFILNDAMYAEDYNGNKIEIVLLTNDLNIWQQILLSHNLNSFESKLLGDEAYRQKVQKELS